MYKKKQFRPYNEYSDYIGIAAFYRIKKYYRSIEIFNFKVGIFFLNIPFVREHQMYSEFPL